MKTILLIDDNHEIHNSLRPIAAAHGYTLSSAYDGPTGMAMAQSGDADIIILDVMLPQSNGFTVCRKIREAGCDTPVIFLTAKSDIVDKSIGFEAGGDDYMTKPFQSEELFMRISAVLRRTGSCKTSTEASTKSRQDVVIGDLTLRPSQYLVEKIGRNVGLTAKEFEIVHLLSSSVGDVFSKEQIYEHLWNESNQLSLDSITVLVRRIREKIEDDPSNPTHLLTVWRIGYRLV